MHGGAGEGEEMIDTKALAERIHKAINWPGDETLSELLDDELRPLLAELANIRGELLAAKTARDLAVTVERAKAYDDGFKAGMAASTATAMPASEGIRLNSDHLSSENASLRLKKAEEVPCPMA